MRSATTLRPRLWLNALWTIPQVDLHSVDPVARWLIMGRAAVLIMTFISALLGGLFAAIEGAFDVGRFALATLSLLLAHLASNLANDYFDFRHGKDTPDSPRVRYGPHPLAHRGTTPAELWIDTLVTSAAAALIGLYLTRLAGLAVLAFIAAGAVILLGYTGGPFPLKYHGLGELAVCVVWGPLMVGGTVYVQVGHLPAWVVAASLPYAFGVTTVLLGKHLDKLGIRPQPEHRNLAGRPWGSYSPTRDAGAGRLNAYPGRAGGRLDAASRSAARAGRSAVGHAYGQGPERAQAAGATTLVRWHHVLP